jgi:hypothetical protein
MDHLDQVLASGSLNFDYSAALRAGLSLGKKLLNKYYHLTDNSEVCRMAISKLLYNI